MNTRDSIEDISVEGEGIRLGQFLKLSGLIDSGGDAKGAIGEGSVSVNGVIETRRGCQLQEGDLVTFENRTARVRY